MTDLAATDLDNPLADGDLLVGTDRTKVAGELAFSLRPVDLAGGLAGLLLCIGHLPAVLAPAWTVRFATVIALAPVGFVMLVRLMRQRDLASWFAGAFVIVATISALLSATPLLSLTGFAGGDTSTLLYAAIVGLWAFGRSLDRRSVRVLEVTIVAALVANVAFGTLQLVFNIRGGAYNSFGSRASGFLFNPIYFGAVMAGALGLAGCRALAGRSSAHLPLVGVFAFGVGLSGSRGAFGVAALAALAALIVIRSWRVIPVLLVGVTGFIAAWVLTSSITSSSTVTRFQEKGGDGRLQMWGFDLAAIWEKPLLGWGLGRSQIAVQSHYTAEFARQFGSDDAWPDPHNIVILILVSTGAIGLVVAVSFAVSAFAATHDRALATMALMIGASWAFEPATIQTLPLALLLLGAAGSTGLVSSDLRPVRRFEVPAAALLGVVVGAASIVPAYLTRQAIIQGDPAAAASGASWYGRDPGIATAVANVYANAAYDDPGASAGALEWSERSVRWEPDRAFWRVKAANIAIRFEQFDVAREHLDVAVGLHPWNLFARETQYLLAIITHDDLAREQALQIICELESDLCTDGVSSANLPLLPDDEPPTPDVP